MCLVYEPAADVVRVRGSVLGPQQLCGVVQRVHPRLGALQLVAQLTEASEVALQLVRRTRQAQRLSAAHAAFCRCQLRH